MTIAATDALGPSSTWADWVDRVCESVGDRLNPILVKETRQALKSRQFVITFSVLLFAALGWTIVGSLSMMPRIYSSPSAGRMLIGYYIVLAIPMLLVVPLAAYRSLEGEIDDGTLELLSITVLSPWQIVLGKLASAMLQMLLYFVALFPCVAYAYTLRGVDLLTVLLIISGLSLAGVLLTIASLFFAPLARTRTGRIATLLAVMALLLGAEWLLAFLIIGMLMEGNPLTSEQLTYGIIASVMLALSLGHLLLASTAAQLTPESENRSTHVRVSIMALTAVCTGLMALATQLLEDEEGFFVTLFMLTGLAALWTLASSMMCGESQVMTPRVRRELPSSLAARATLTWLTPGPTTGLAFSAVCLVLGTTVTVSILSYADSEGLWSMRSRDFDILRRLCIGYTTYLIGFLVIVRWIMSIVRRKHNPRAELGFATLIAVAVLAALVPYSIGLHLNDYRPYDYSLFQITNWAWTIGETMDRPGLMYIVWLVGCVALGGFFASLLANPELVFARRIATPKRVQEAKEQTRT